MTNFRMTNEAPMTNDECAPSSFGLHHCFVILASSFGFPPKRGFMPVFSILTTAPADKAKEGLVVRSRFRGDFDDCSTPVGDSNCLLVARFEWLLLAPPRAVRRML